MSTIEKINLLLADTSEETLEAVYDIIKIIIPYKNKKAAVSQPEPAEVKRRFSELRAEMTDKYGADYDWDGDIIRAAEEKYGRAD